MRDPSKFFVKSIISLLLLINILTNHSVFCSSSSFETGKSNLPKKYVIWAVKDQVRVEGERSNTEVEQLSGSIASLEIGIEKTPPPIPTCIPDYIQKGKVGGEKEKKINIGKEKEEGELEKEKERDKKRFSSLSLVFSSMSMEEEEETSDAREVIIKGPEHFRKKDLEIVKERKKNSMSEFSKTEKNIQKKDFLIEFKQSKLEDDPYGDYIHRYGETIRENWNKALSSYNEDPGNHADVEYYKVRMGSSDRSPYQLQPHGVLTQEVIQRLKDIYNRRLMRLQFIMFPITEGNEGLKFVDPNPYMKPHRIKLLSPIGHGAFGVTFLCEDIDDSHKKLVMKHFFDVHLQEHRRYQQSAFPYNDMDILTESLGETHENIVTPVGFSIDSLIIHKVKKPQVPDVFFKYVKGVDIFRNIRHRPHFYMNLRASLYQLLRALEFLHSREIIHRDLSASNILLRGNDEVVLCDFGVSVAEKSERRWSEHPSLTHEVYRSWYRPPEIYKKKPYTCSADIWALGMLALALITKGSMFSKCGDDRLVYEEIESNYQFNTGRIYSDKFLQIIYKINDIAQKEGMLATVQNFKDLLIRMLQFEPSKRITAAEAMNHDFFKEPPDLDSQ